MLRRQKIRSAMANPLKLSELITVLRDAERVVSQAHIVDAHRPVAYREVVQKLLDNEYEDDLPGEGKVRRPPVTV
jgi:hypothetical protein